MPDSPNEIEVRTPKEPAVNPVDGAIDSRSLFQGRREVLIQHEGETYRLLETRNGKLILQK